MTPSDTNSLPPLDPYADSVFDHTDLVNAPLALGPNNSVYSFDLIVDPFEHAHQAIRHLRNEGLNRYHHNAAVVPRDKSFPHLHCVSRSAVQVSAPIERQLLTLASTYVNYDEATVARLRPLLKELFDPYVTFDAAVGLFTGWTDVWHSGETPQRLALRLR